MDLLSDVIAVLWRRTAPVLARPAVRPAGQRFECPPDSAAFLVPLRGSCWLMHDGSEPLELGAGDVVFLPRGCGHTLADHPSTRVEAPVPKIHRPAGTSPPSASAGRRPRIFRLT